MKSDEAIDVLNNWHNRGQPGNGEKQESTLCGCGYEEGSFACRIRHVQLNTGDAKAARD